MLKQFLTFLLILISLYTNAQDTLRYDTLITTKAYKSYYSKKYKAPVAVSFILYKGGGDCSREGMEFKNDIKKLSTAFDSDYKGSGYDKGHMANAEDFAYDCTLEELTFRYYNAAPQTPELNRGPWSKMEAVIRIASQTDSLCVICYNEFDGKKIKKDKSVYVPSKCYKFVYSIKTKKIIYAFYFTNTNKPIYHDLMKSLPKYKAVTDHILKY